MAEAKTIFKTRCGPCHGLSGKGDGPAAKALKPKPRNYSDKKWQATVTDAQIAKVILLGGPAVKLAAIMPPAPDLKAKPEVINGLVQIIRGFAQK